MSLPLGFIEKNQSEAIAIHFIELKDYENWLAKQDAFSQTWIQQLSFQVKHGEWFRLPDKNHIAKIIFMIDFNQSFFDMGKLPAQLPQNNYYFADISDDVLGNAILAWGLGAYQFSVYKKPTRLPANLVIHENDKVKQAEIFAMIEAISSARDFINLPAEECHPEYFSQLMKNMAKQYKNTRFSEIVGEELLAQGFNLIHAVGRSSHYAPRLLEINYGNPSHKKLTLIGKGVCFDSGGLDIKPSNYMLLMKKDMGGAAIVLGLTELILKMQLPIYLQVLIPAVENLIDARSYRPGDVIRSRAGLTVEIGNTDAEGRLVLADAIHYAINSEQRPDCLIDIATLTGAARIALGTELPALFSNDDRLANQLTQSGEKTGDLMWRMPLFSAYKELNNSTIADINNSSSESYGGAITAALFLQAFIPENLSWAHFDVMAWNTKTKPARPQGGEAMTLRAIYYFIKNYFIEN